MPDTPFAGQQSLDTSKTGALDAMAAGGTAGKQQYEAAQASNAADRTAAVGTALQGTLNPGDQSAITKFAGAPYDQMGGRLGREQGIQGLFNQGMTKSEDTYFNQMQAAVPMIQEETKQKLAVRKQALDAIQKQAEAKIAADAQARADARELHQATLAEIHARTTAAGAKVGKGPTNEAVKTDLIGGGMRAAANPAVAEQLLGIPQLQGARQASYTPPNALAGEGPTRGGRYSNVNPNMQVGAGPRINAITGLIDTLKKQTTDPFVLARIIGEASGYDPNQVAYVLGPETAATFDRANKELNPADKGVAEAAAKVQMNPRDYAGVLNSPWFRTISGQSRDMLAGGNWSFDQAPGTPPVTGTAIPTRDEFLASVRTKLFGGDKNLPTDAARAIFDVVEKTIAVNFPIK